MHLSRKKTLSFVYNSIVAENRKGDNNQNENNRKRGEEEMARKLTIMLLIITMIACSSISIYATDVIGDNNTKTTTEVESDNAAAEEAAAKKAEAAKKAAAVKKKAEKYKKGLAAYIRKINPNVSKTKSLNMAGEFIAKGKKFNLDAKVLMAIARNESTFYTNARSPYGYKGLMQTSDALARKYGYKPSSLYKANVSIYVGAKYLRGMKNQFNTYTKALSAYAYGSGAVSAGNYSTSIAKKMLRTRDDINSFLKRNNYI